MPDFTLHQLRCFDAVVQEGSFQAAAQALNRTHPSVYSAVKSLEAQAGIALFDRSGYRVELTEAGRSFHDKVRELLAGADALKRRAQQLSTGEETMLSLVIGDVSPLPPTLAVLNKFFADHPQTRLDLHFEALSGPLERLLDGEADMIIHHVEQSDTRLEAIPLHAVKIIPVVAPGFLEFAIHDAISPDDMRAYPQCIIRDSATRLPKQDYYVLQNARHWTAGDQHTKRQIILQGMGWGHLPDFLIEDDLGSGRLVPITGRHFPGGTVEISAVRLRDKPHGPIANLLWRHADQTVRKGAWPSK